MQIAVSEWTAPYERSTQHGKNRKTSRADAPELEFAAQPLKFVLGHGTALRVGPLQEDVVPDLRGGKSKVE